VATTHTAHERAHERDTRATRTAAILGELDRTVGPERREQLLGDLVEANMCVARSIAARYRNRGISDDDLEQVAYLALVRSARAYDHTSGHDFLSYVVPSIRGEVRRYFRDQGWMVRPRRRVQEIQSVLERTESDLQHSLGRPPEPEELATELGASVPEVREALAATGCFFPVSLDQVTSTETTSIGDQLGAPDRDLAVIEARLVLAPLVQELSARERRILELRFFRDCTQQEIAEDIGVTQMQVSRLLTRIMADLRKGLEGTTEPRETAGGSRDGAAVR
jgi:RNA polymerase sigma-B factor